MSRKMYEHFRKLSIKILSDMAVHEFRGAICILSKQKSGDYEFNYISSSKGYLLAMKELVEKILSSSNDSQKEISYYG